MVKVGGQAQVEEGNAEDELDEAEGGELGGPVLTGDGSVGGQPTADTEGVGELEQDGGNPDERVDWGHGWLYEGEEDGAI